MKAQQIDTRNAAHRIRSRVARVGPLAVLLAITWMACPGAKLVLAQSESPLAATIDEATRQLDDDQAKGDQANGDQANQDQTNADQTNQDQTNQDQTNQDQTSRVQTNRDQTNVTSGDKESGAADPPAKTTGGGTANKAQDAAPNGGGNGPGGGNGNTTSAANSGPAAASTNGAGGNPEPARSAHSVSEGNSAAPALAAGPGNGAVAISDPKSPIAVDTASLVKLAGSLKSDVDKTTKDTLSVTVVREAAEIEQLAHKMRSR